MNIEICGLPGTGKTTFVRKMSGVDKINIISANSKLEIFYYFLKLLIKYPKFTSRTLVLAVTSLPSISLFWNSLFTRLAKFEKSSSTPNGLSVVEEGLHQNIFSFAVEILEDDKLEKYYMNMPITDLVIILNVDESRRKEFIKKRTWRKSNITESEKREEAMVCVNRRFIDMVKNKPQYKVVGSIQEAETIVTQYI